MADSQSSEELFDLWRRQVQAATEAWAKSVQDMTKSGHVPPGPPDPTMFFRPFLDQNVNSWAGWMNATPASPDLLKQWKKFLDDWLAAWTDALEQVMGTEAFAQALGKTLDQFLSVQGQAKQGVDRTTKATIDALGLPSKDQVVGLARHLMDLEDRLEALDEKIDALTTQTAGSTKKKDGK